MCIRDRFVHRSHLLTAWYGVRALWHKCEDVPWHALPYACQHSPSNSIEFVQASACHSMPISPAGPTSSTDMHRFEQSVHINPDCNARQLSSDATAPPVHSPPQLYRTSSRDPDQVLRRKSFIMRSSTTVKVVAVVLCVAGAPSLLEHTALALDLDRCHSGVLVPATSRYAERCLFHMVNIPFRSTAVAAASCRAVQAAPCSGLDSWGSSGQLCHVHQGDTSHLRTRGNPIS